MLFLSKRSFHRLSVICWTHPPAPCGRTACDYRNMCPGGEAKPCVHQIVEALKTKLFPSRVRINRRGPADGPLAAAERYSFSDDLQAGDIRGIAMKLPAHQRRNSSRCTTGIAIDVKPQKLPAISKMLQFARSNHLAHAQRNPNGAVQVLPSNLPHFKLCLIHPDYPPVRISICLRSPTPPQTDEPG